MIQVNVLNCAASKSIVHVLKHTVTRVTLIIYKVGNFKYVSHITDTAVNMVNTNTNVSLLFFNNKVESVRFLFPKAHIV